MSGELAGHVFIYMCGLHWLEGVELGRAAEKEEKGEWGEQLGAYDVSGMVQGLKLKELLFKGFMGHRSTKKSSLVPRR